MSASSILCNSYFSGAGLMDLGLEQGGVHVQQSFEMDADACATLRANARPGHEVVQCDITKKLVRKEKDCNVMVATFPCTKYSTIADISDTRTGDDLFLHFFRHLAIKQPEIYIVENVPGLKKFPVVMEAMTKLPGYYVNVFCPVNASLWLPQDRPRLFIIGSKRNFLWREPESPGRIGLKDILEADANPEIPDYVATRMSGAYRDLPIISYPERDDIAPLCVAHYAKDRSTRLVADKRFPLGVRPYTVLEFARLQGVPDTYKFPVSPNAALKQIGNGVAIPPARWLGEEVCRYFNN